MEYKPKPRRIGINPPFGYYVCPVDQTILIPDPKKLDAIHYAFRMKAKYATSIGDCVMWLHAATGQRMSRAGFLLAYRTWLKRLRKERAPELAKKRKALLAQKQAFIEENFKQFGILLNDRDDIAAVADGQAKAIRKKAQEAAR